MHEGAWTLPSTQYQYLELSTEGMASMQLTRAANSAKEMSPDLSQSYLLSQVVTSSSEIQLCTAEFMRPSRRNAGHDICGMVLRRPDFLV